MESIPEQTSFTEKTHHKQSWVRWEIFKLLSTAKDSTEYDFHLMLGCDGFQKAGTLCYPPIEAVQVSLKGQVSLKIVWSSGWNLDYEVHNTFLSVIL